MNGPNLWPVNTLLMSNYLPIPAWDVGTQVTGARGAEHSGFFLLARGTVGPWVPVPALCQGASAQGVELINTHHLGTCLVAQCLRQCSQYRGQGVNPDWGAKIRHATQ